MSLFKRGYDDLDRIEKEIQERRKEPSFSISEMK